MAEAFLSELLVVELGDRTAAGACGSLLAELGATVLLVEPTGIARAGDSKWLRRAVVAAGKRSIVIDPGQRDDQALLRLALANADVVVTSSDRQPAWVGDTLRHVPDGAIRCDITAFGSSGPLSGHAHSDWLVQAMTGVIDTTGDPAGAPVSTRLPIIELAGAIYATAGIISALRVQRMQGLAQSVEIALFDCGVSMLATFLPAHFVGREPKRIGNHHPSMSPWNAYRAKDGWVMVCLGSDDHWRRVCELIGRPELATDARYVTPTDRVKRNAEVDRVVESWTAQRTVERCVEQFNAAALPSGPVYRIADVLEDPSLVHRGMVRQVVDPLTGAMVRLPGSVLRGNRVSGRPAPAVSRPDADREWVRSLAGIGRDRAATPASGSPKAVLNGVRVIEIGNYTTAPLCARQLGALGADVVKVEPPAGDLARPLPPLRDGQGYFFTLSNSDKRSVALDLRTAEGKATFREMLAVADVLVENLKPGSLARLQFGAPEIARINPRLVYCPVSGFGSDSPFANRPAMDTTVQGMAGIMDLTRAQGVPYKTGISIADLAGGEFSLTAILAALEYRDRTGKGVAMDLSMQDAAAWLTHVVWNGGPTGISLTLIRCEDGFVAAEASRGALASLGHGIVPDAMDEGVGSVPGTRRRELVDVLVEKGIAAAPVLAVGEVVMHGQTAARRLIVTGRSATGVEWPLLASPIRLSRTPPRVQRAIGGIGADGPDVMAEWLSAESAKPGQPGGPGMPQASNAATRRRSRADPPDSAR
ncbi:MAG: CoA transferase [Betaproteobacteria bacterium]|nr:CoA transferase [Betaproteobacteria bacterium]